MIDNIEDAEKFLALAIEDVRADMGDDAVDEGFADIVAGVALSYSVAVGNDLMDRNLGYRVALPGRPL